MERTNGTVCGGVIDAQALGRVVDLIVKTVDRDTRKINVRGVLVGINIKTKTFRFVERDGPDYIGDLSDEFPLTRRWSVNTNYTADIIVEESIKYATMDKKSSYKLARLKGRNTT